MNLKEMGISLGILEGGARPITSQDESEVQAMMG